MKTKEIKYKKFYIGFLILFLLSAIGLRVWQKFYWPDSGLYLAGEKINVLVAETMAQRYKGLSGREDLGDYDGMIFIYSEPDRLGVVMREMLFPLDIVWFYNGMVVDIAPNVPIEPGAAEADLRVYFPRTEANVFLELPAGWTEEHNLKIGDKLEVVE